LESTVLVIFLSYQVIVLIFYVFVVMGNKLSLPLARHKSVTTPFHQMDDLYGAGPCRSFVNQTSGALRQLTLVM